MCRHQYFNERSSVWWHVIGHLHKPLNEVYGSVARLCDTVITVKSFFLWSRIFLLLNPISSYIVAFISVIYIRSLLTSYRIEPNDNERIFLLVSKCTQSTLSITIIFQKFSLKWLNLSLKRSTVILIWVYK